MFKLINFYLCEVYKPHINKGYSRFHLLRALKLNKND